MATQPCPTCINQDSNKASKSSTFKTLAHSPQPTTGQSTATNHGQGVAAGTCKNRQRRVLAWCVSRQDNQSAVPCDQSQATTKQCRTTQTVQQQQQQQSIVQHTWHTVNCATITQCSIQQTTPQRTQHAHKATT